MHPCSHKSICQPFNFFKVGGMVFLLPHGSCILAPVDFYIILRFRRLSEASSSRSIRRISGDNEFHSIYPNGKGYVYIVDDFVFRSASNRRFAATVTAHRAVLVWKKKLPKKKKK